MTTILETLRGSRSEKVLRYRLNENSYYGTVTDASILRNLRNETARNMHVPAYVVFADKTLQEMSTYLPVTREEMLEISGVAQAKYEKYGELFIGVIREYKAGHEETHKLPTARARIRF